MNPPPPAPARPRLVPLRPALYPQDVSFVVPVSGGVGGSIFEGIYHSAEFIEISRMRIRSSTLTMEEKQTITRLLRQVMSAFIEAKWSKLMPFQKEQIKLIMNMDTRQLFAFLETARLAEVWDWDLRRRAEKVICPVLAIYGEDDRQVPPNLNATRLREYLLEANNGDFEVIVIPGANHVLARTGSGLNGDFIPGYLDKMTAWIRAHTTGTGSKTALR